MLRLFKQYYPIRNIIFVLVEGFIIWATVTITSSVFGYLGQKHTSAELLYKALLFTIVCQICLYYLDLYDYIVINIKKTSVKLLQALGMTAITVSVIYFVFPVTIIEYRYLSYSILLTAILILTWRISYSEVLRRGLFNKPIIILGADEMAQQIVNEIKLRKDCGYKIACIVLGKHHKDTMLEADSPCIQKSRYKGISELAQKLKIYTIVVAIKEKRGELPMKELLKCKVNGVDVLDGNSFYEMLTGKLIVSQTHPSWLIFSDGFKKSTFKRVAKRITDLLLSIVLLIVFAPLNVLVSILIKLDSEGPIIFSQKRVGQAGKEYMIYKFRSMIADAEEKSGPVWTSKNDQRITRVGKVIRKVRIDELPQLFNVLKGEMSLVGPRPERKYFVERLSNKIPYYRERFSVKPGVTGWAQVSYGYGSTEEDAIEKLNYDLFYIKNLSSLMDLMIILKTIKIVIFGRGAR